MDSGSIVGTGADMHLPLVATRAIKQGEPIQACYGWDYWYEPNLFTKVFMRQAFEGYIHYIRDAEEVHKAWAYAVMFACCVEQSAKRPARQHCAFPGGHSRLD